VYNFKIIAASQANNVYKDKNTKKKTLNCSANIVFKQQCLKKYLIPNYSNSCVKRFLFIDQFAFLAVFFFTVISLKINVSSSL